METLCISVLEISNGCDTSSVFVVIAFWFFVRIYCLSSSGLIDWCQGGKDYKTYVCHGGTYLHWGYGLCTKS